MYPTRAWGTNPGVSIKDDTGFDATKGEVIADVQDGKTLVFDLGDAAGVDISATPYLNVKGYVPAELTRIKLNYKAVGASKAATVQSYWYYPSDTGKNQTTNTNATEAGKSYFEYHGSLASISSQPLASIQLYCYVSGSAAAEVQILGLAFDADGSYNSFRAPSIPDASVKYTVDFDLNGGEGTTPASITDVENGSKITAPTAVPTRSGYVFAGWATAASGGAVWDFASDTVTKNMTLYAVWAPEVNSVAIRDVAVGTNDETNNEATIPVIDETAHKDFAKGELTATAGYRGLLQFRVGDDENGAVLGTCNWLNMKLYVSEEIPRVLFMYKLRGKGAVRFHDSNSAWSQPQGSIQYNGAERTYEVHIPLAQESNEILTSALDTIVVEFRPATGATGQVIMLGVAFDKDGTYSDWASVETPTPNQPNGYAITAPRSNGAVKVEEDGSQVISYEAPRDYSTFTIAIDDFSYDKPIFEIVFTPSHDIKMGYQFPTVDPDDSGLWLDKTFGHKGYEGGARTTQRIDLQNTEELKDFTIGQSLTIGLYIDARNGEGARTITVHSVQFVERPAAPTGFYLGEPETRGNIVCMDSAQGYKINYTTAYDDTNYNNVYFAFNNYDPEYDIIKVDIQSYKGMRLGILVEHTEIDGEGKPQLVQTYLRSHHQAAEGVFDSDGRNSLYYFTNALGIGGKQLQGIRLYFEPPIDRDNRVLGEHTVVLYGITVVRSQDQDFEDMTMTVKPATVTYGDKVQFEVSTVDDQGNDLTLPVRYQYRVKGFTGAWSLATPTDVGEYDVQIIFMGSLSYNYQIKTTTLTITKANSVTPANGVTIDAARKVTVAAGVEASLSATFEAGSEVLDGTTVESGVTVYYRAKADANHNAGETLQVKAPQESPAQPGDEPGNEPGNEPDNTSSDSGSGNGGGKKKKGCGSNVSAAMLPVALLCLAAGVLVLRKKRESK